MFKSQIVAFRLLLAILFMLPVYQSGLVFGQDTAQDFDILARRASNARVEGNSSEAIRYYETALKIRPDWPEGWWYLGTLYADAGRFTDAIPVFRKLTDANPKLGPAWASLGLSEFELKDYQNSLIHLQQAQELGFAEVPYMEKPAAYHLALLLNLNGEFEDAFGVLSSEFGKEALAQQTRVALGMSLLRIQLLPEQLDPGKDALISEAGEAAERLVSSNLEQAFQTFRQMLQDYPNTPYLHYAYGSALDFSSRYGEAEAQLREETRVTPNSALPYMRLAAIALKTHRPADVQPLAQRAVELAPQSNTAHRILAKALTELNKTEAAAQETAAAERLDPEKTDVDSKVAAAYTNHFTSIENFVSRTEAGTTQSDTFDELSRKAVAAGQAGRTEEASSHYRDALKLRPDWDEGWTQLGTLFYIAGRHSDGISALKNALSINRERADAWVFLGLCEFETKENRNAYLHLEHGRELGFHGTPEAQRVASLRLSELRTWRGDFDGAKDLLIPEVDRNQLTDTTKAVLGLIVLRIPRLPDQVEPSREALVRTAGETAALLYAERYNEAFQAFQKMLKDFPNTPYLHYAYASALESLAQHDEAEVQLRKEIKLAPRDALAYTRLADIFLKTEHPEDALSNAERAVELDASAPGSRELLGRALLETGKTEAAIKELEIASRLAPNYPEVHFNLARAYTKAKMMAEAERERAIFARLNAEEETQKTSQGNSRTFIAPYDQKNSPSTDARVPSSTPR
jgi:tetratricopeptide (TPR) repeat protein